MTGPVAAALADFRAAPGTAGWLALPFFRDGAAERIAAAVDARAAAGAAVLPPADAVFNALSLTPLERVKVVILGQDPYPTPGDAHGLAFSYVGSRRLPPSLKTILAEMADDLGCPAPACGDLSHWAHQGVLLLNTALTVEAGAAGAHLQLGWSALADQAVAAVSAERPAIVFMLWGAPARRRAALIDRNKHLVLECGHPSPLNRANDFRGTRPFSRANAWLQAHGETPIDWRLDGPSLPEERVTLNPPYARPR
jgi:uracil-DNA glycosylase